MNCEATRPLNEEIRDSCQMNALEARISSPAMGSNGLVRECDVCHRLLARPSIMFMTSLGAS